MEEKDYVTRDECREYRKELVQRIIKQENKNEEQDKTINSIDKTLAKFTDKTNTICKILWAIASLIGTSVLTSLLQLIL